ncbi:hypothetical protein [Microbacterium sp.]|uniref:hypothetical protein n=1 Tax=Microbacterium sp. TaxID=51671 RepID=UPI0039E56B56
MHIMGAVIRPLKNSLDDMPVHVRQLAEMFRKHGQKQTHTSGRVKDLDATDVPQPLRDGWKQDSWHTPDRVVGAGKPNRPYPGEYLDADYIKQHLARFEDGATRFYRADSLGRHGPGNGGTTFVFPTSEIDNLVAQAGGDKKTLGVLLGLGEDYFDDGSVIMRADFSYEEVLNGNLRMPRGSEGGANAQWIPGGYLPEGLPEAVFDVHPEATPSDPSVGGSWGSWNRFTP